MKTTNHGRDTRLECVLIRLWNEVCAFLGAIQLLEKDGQDAWFYLEPLTKPNKTSASDVCGTRLKSEVGKVNEDLRGEEAFVCNGRLG